MTDADGGSTRKLLAVYLAWAIVFGLAFGAGGYTMGHFVDIESIGNADSPNTFEAAGNFGIESAANNGNNGDPVANNDDGVAENQPPQAAYIAERKGRSKNVVLDGSDSTDPDGTIVSYEWYFGNTDGSNPDATGETARVNIDIGEVVTLIVTDDDGATDSESKTIDQ